MMWFRGTFYGTKHEACEACEAGCDLVFSVTGAGVERDIAQVRCGIFGALQGAPIAFNGDLYVADSSGGNSACTSKGDLGPWGCGGVYKLQRPDTLTPYMSSTRAPTRSRRVHRR